MNTANLTNEVMSFFQNLFLTSEERHIRRVVAQTGTIAAIAIFRRVPMVGFVERIQFEHTGDRILSSVSTVVGQPKKEPTTSEVGLAAFGSAFKNLGIAHGNLTAVGLLGVKDGESYTIVWADASGYSRIFVRCPITSSVVQKVLDTLLPKCS